MLHTAKRCEVLGGQALAQRTAHEAVRGLRRKPDPTLRPERIMRRRRRHRRCQAHKAGAGIPGAASQASPVLGGSAVVVDDHPERQNGVPRAMQPAGRGCPLATRKLRLVEKLLQLSRGGKQQPALTAAVALAVMLHMRQPLRPVPHRRGVADHQNLEVGGAVECRQLAHHRPQQSACLVHIPDERDSREALQPNHLGHVVDVFLLQQKLAQGVTGGRFDL